MCRRGWASRQRAASSGRSNVTNASPVVRKCSRSASAASSSSTCLFESLVSAARTIRLCDHDVCTRERGEARRGWSREPKNGTPRLGVKYLGALLALTVALTGPAPPVCFCASERGREAPRRDARGGCPTPVRPRWRPRLGSSRCARVLRLPRRDERARSPGSPSTQNPASSVVAVGGSDAGIPDRVAPFPGSRLTPRSPPPPTTAA